MAREYFEEKKHARDLELLRAHECDFKHIGGKKISRKGKVNKFHPRFECLWCKRTFGTPVTAMVDHIKAHKADEFILVGGFVRSDEGKVITREDPNFGICQPSQHWWIPEKGTTWFDPRCNLKEIDIPEANRVQEGWICCRHCQERQQEWGDGVTICAKLKRVRNLLKHEKACKKKAGSVRNEESITDKNESKKPENGQEAGISAGKKGAESQGGVGENLPDKPDGRKGVG